jgi:hypothetical protein
MLLPSLDEDFGLSQMGCDIMKTFLSCARARLHLPRQWWRVGRKCWISCKNTEQGRLLVFVSFAGGCQLSWSMQHCLCFCSEDAGSVVLLCVHMLAPFSKGNGDYLRRGKEHLLQGHTRCFCIQMLRVCVQQWAPSTPSGVSVDWISDHSQGLWEW